MRSKKENNVVSFSPETAEKESYETLVSSGLDVIRNADDAYKQFKKTWRPDYLDYVPQIGALYLNRILQPIICRLESTFNQELGKKIADQVAAFAQKIGAPFIVIGKNNIHPTEGEHQELTVTEIKSLIKGFGKFNVKLIDVVEFSAIHFDSVLYRPDYSYFYSISEKYKTI